MNLDAYHLTMLVASTSLQEIYTQYMGKTCQQRKNQGVYHSAASVTQSNNILIQNGATEPCIILFDSFGNLLLLCGGLGPDEKFITMPRKDYVTLEHIFYRGIYMYEYKNQLQG